MESGGYSLVVVRGLLLEVAPLVQHRSEGHSWRTGLVALQHVGSSQTGMEPMSPALAGKFCTTEPPGKPLQVVQF